MVSVCLPSDALLQHLPSYLGFSYLGRGVSLHGCSSKAQPLLLTLDKGYLLTAALPDLQCGIAPLGSPAPAQPGLRVTPLVRCPWPPEWVAPPCRHPWPWAWGRGVAPPVRRPWPRWARHSTGGCDRRVIAQAAATWRAIVRPRGDTPRPRSRGCAGAGGPRGAIPH